MNRRGNRTTLTELAPLTASRHLNEMSCPSALLPDSIQQVTHIPICTKDAKTFLHCCFHRSGLDRVGLPDSTVEFQEALLFRLPREGGGAHPHPFTTELSGWQCRLERAAQNCLYSTARFGRTTFLSIRHEGSTAEGAITARFRLCQQGFYPAVS